MFTTTAIEGSNVVEVEFDGAVRQEPMAECHAILQRVIDAHGSVRLLVVYGAIDMRHTELGGLWEDLRNTPLIPRIARCAIVADQSWIRRVSALVGPLLPGEVRTWSRADVEEARAWVRS